MTTATQKPRAKSKPRWPPEIQAFIDEALAVARRNHQIWVGNIDKGEEG